MPKPKKHLERPPPPLKPRPPPTPPPLHAYGILEEEDFVAKAGTWIRNVKAKSEAASSSKPVAWVRKGTDE
jgi:hypothetical protein